MIAKLEYGNNAMDNNGNYAGFSSTRTIESEVFDSIDKAIKKLTV